MRVPAGGFAAASIALALASCNDGATGYVEIKAVPATAAVSLYLDSVKLEPLRNGNAVLRQSIGTAKLQTEAAGGELTVLCSIEVKKNRITSVTVSALSRPPRCQCGRPSGADPPANRLCIG